MSICSAAHAARHPLTVSTQMCRGGPQVPVVGNSDLTTASGGQFSSFGEDRLFWHLWTLVRDRPPGRSLAAVRKSPAQSRRPTGASAADQGVRPTTDLQTCLGSLSEQYFRSSAAAG